MKLQCIKTSNRFPREIHVIIHCMMLIPQFFRTEESLEALIGSVKAASHMFTKDTNRLCALILNHCELNLSKLPANLQCFESYNGTELCPECTFVTVLFLRIILSRLNKPPAQSNTHCASLFQMGYVVILIKNRQGCGCSKGTLIRRSKV